MSIMEIAVLTINSTSGSGFSIDGIWVGTDLLQQEIKNIVVCLPIQHPENPTPLAFKLDVTQSGQVNKDAH